MNSLEIEFARRCVPLSGAIRTRFFLAVARSLTRVKLPGLGRLARATRIRAAMSKERWHKVMEPVHHSHPNCEAGQAARGKYHRTGTGGKPLCPECASLCARDDKESDSESDPPAGS